MHVQSSGAGQRVSAAAFVREGGPPGSDRRVVSEAENEHHHGSWPPLPGAACMQPAQQQRARGSPNTALVREGAPPGSERRVVSEAENEQHHGSWSPLLPDAACMQPAQQQRVRGSLQQRR
jgi:hypothetical protein